MTNCAEIIQGYATGECIEKECHVNTCTAGYHLDNGNNRCIADTNDCCGTSCTRCNTPNVCSKGTCEAQCKSPLSKCNNECHNYANDINHCGACNNACTTAKVSNSANVVCVDSTCKAISCQPGYHVYNGTCEADSITHCGAHNARCNVANATNTCSGSKCSFTCKTDFHTYNNICEKDDTNHCGAHEEVCANTVPGWKRGECKNKQCKATECQSGSHLTKQGACEPDTDACCGTTCQSCNTNSTCIDGVCQSKCLVMNDPEIAQYATEHWDTDQDGCLSRSEAAAVTEIPEKAFYNNTNLKSLADLEQFPNLKTIGNSAFEGCSGLTSVSLPQATEIGDYAFYRCTGLTSIDLPQATEIGEYAFYGCTGLTSINLPQVTFIGDHAFSGSTNLTSLVLTSSAKITLTTSSLAPYHYGNEFYYGEDTLTLDLDKVTLTLHKNKAMGGSSSPLCTSATQWGGETWKEIRFVE